MQATKEYISLETAKLLKDCGVESKYYYNRHLADNNFCLTETDHSKISRWESFPAFTWQEILWEYSLESLWEYFATLLAKEIILLLRQKKYKEADLYFREHCILIPKE